MKHVATAYGQIAGKEEVELVDGLPVNTWLNEGPFVYRLQLSGGYRKGTPNVSNDFSFRVNSTHNMTTEEQANNMGARIADLLRAEQFRNELCQLQAYGRQFYIEHTGMKCFYNVHGGWTGRPEEAMKLGDAIETLRMMEDIQHTQLIDPCLLKIHIFDTNSYSDPINREGKPFVVVRSIATGNTCITGSKRGDNPAVLANGRLGYNVLAYCDTIEEAQEVWSKSMSGQI